MNHDDDEWEKSCLHFWGKVLTGQKAHYCGDFDDLPIDETCDEFKWCKDFEEQPR